MSLVSHNVIYKNLCHTKIFNW